jgi:hypothetical protein
MRIRFSIFCSFAQSSVCLQLVAGAGEEIRPGMVAVVQTFGERVNFHPHVHAIVSRGGWRKDGTWIPVAYADPAEAEKVFRHHVLSFLRKRGLIDEEPSAVRCCHSVDTADHTRDRYRPLKTLPLR